MSSKERDLTLGVKFNREYRDIITDFVRAISHIEDCYTVFEMDDEDWEALGSEEQQEVIRTLADDIFYGLGNDPNMSLGTGHIQYDEKQHILKVAGPDNVVHIVNLI
jgi:hypothetical protein